MSGGEMYFWGAVALVGLLLAAACIAAYRDSLRPSGGARFVSEEGQRALRDAIAAVDRKPT